MVLGKRYMDMSQIKELDKDEFISVVLPAIDIAPPFQTSNFFLFFLHKRIPICNMKT